MGEQNSIPRSASPQFTASELRRVPKSTSTLLFFVGITKATATLILCSNLQMELPAATEATQLVADNDASSSSRGSTPEIQRRRSNVSAPFRNGASDGHKPILAPKSAPPPIPVRTTSSESVAVALRKQHAGRFLIAIRIGDRCNVYAYDCVNLMQADIRNTSEIRPRSSMK